MTSGVDDYDATSVDARAWPAWIVCHVLQHPNASFVVADSQRTALSRTVKELHVRLIQTTASRRHGILDNDEAHAYKSNQEGTCAERELFVVQRRLYYRLCCACHVSQPSPATANLAKVSLMQRVPSGVFRRSNHAFILRILPSRVPAGARQCRIALISRNPFPTWRAGPCGACWGGHGEASRPALSGRHETPQSWWC